MIHDRLAVRHLVERKAYPKRGGHITTPFGEVDLPGLKMLPWKAGSPPPQDPGSVR